MDFEDYLDLSRKKLVAHTHKYFSTKKKEEISPLFKEQKFIEYLEDFIVRGKFLRGSIFLLTIEGLGEKIKPIHLDIACALEFMHSALLIQDDVIDNDFTRRGGKTIFAKYIDDGEKLGVASPYHYGISSAIVVADIAFFFAFNFISNYKDKKLSQILRTYIQEVYMVILSEGADSLFGQTKREPDKNEISNVNLYKTARYTFSLPFKLGVLVSNNSVKTQKMLIRLGELIGIIFQLKDDEIGLFGDEKKIGKPVGGDIRENKKTILRYYLYLKANSSEKKILDKCFGNKDAGEKEIALIREMYKKLNIQNLIDSETKKIMDEVWKIYKKVPFKMKYKEILKSLLEYNLERSS